MAIKTGTLALVGLGALAIYFIMRSKKAQAVVQKTLGTGSLTQPTQPSYPGVLPGEIVVGMEPGIYWGAEQLEPEPYLGIGEVSEIDPLLGPTEEQWDYWGAMAGAG